MKLSSLFLFVVLLLGRKLIRQSSDQLIFNSFMVMPNQELLFNHPFQNYMLGLNVDADFTDIE